MNNLKRLVALGLVLCMAFAFAACGQKEQEPAQNAANTTTETKTTETKTEETKTEEKPAEKTPEELEQEAWEKEPMYGQTIRYMLSDGCSSAVNIAELLGYYEDEGLKVEGFKGDSDIEAVGTNTVQVIVGHLAKQVVPATNGVDLVVVGGAHFGCKSLYVAADSPYQTLEDLKGKKVSTPNGIGKSDYNITARLFDADGINPLEEVDLVQVETSACVPAMQKGELDAALLTDLYAYDMVKDGTLRKIRSMLDEDIDDMCCDISMNGTFVKENPITATKLANAVKKASKWMGENPEEAVDLMLKEGLTAGDRDKNIEYFSSLRCGVSDEECEKQLRDIVEDYLRLGLCTTTDDADTIMGYLWHPLGSAD